MPPPPPLKVTIGTAHPLVEADEILQSPKTQGDSEKSETSSRLIQWEARDPRPTQEVKAATRSPVPVRLMLNLPCGQFAAL